MAVQRDDYDLRPLVAGTIKGVRSFEVDKLGRLKGPQKNTVWKPGENQAVCKKGGSAFAVPAYAGGVSLASSGYFDPKTMTTTWIDPVSGNTYTQTDLISSKTGEVQFKKTDHKMENCQCGFYGYHDGSDDFKTDATISAVIEGYGETIVGTRGFRSTKARILALHIEEKPHGKVYAFQSWAYEYGVPLFIAGAVGSAVFLGLIVGAVAGHWGPQYTLGYFGLTLFCAFIALLFGLSANRFEKTLNARKVTITPEIAARIKRNYPEVKFFKSFEAMIKAFPPDKQADPSPENDPDFWSRSA